MLNDPDRSGRAQGRENAEPSEHIRPIPIVVWVVTLAVVLAGAAYLLMSESFGPATFGDRRTLADLRGAPAGAVADGKILYTAHCVACHQATGKGLTGVFPPLDGSEWVNGEPHILGNILLHGIDGEIEVEGHVYKGQMPAFNQLADAELAAIASWIRSQWANKSPAIETAYFEQLRKGDTRDKPFTGGAELKSLAAPAK